MSLLLFGGWHIFGPRAPRAENSRRSRTVERDKRFAVPTSLLYRPTGTLIWYRGAIQNISASGILFQAEHLVPVDSPIEMSLALPAEAGSKRKVQVFCWGKVARAVEPPASGASPALAAKIVRYRSDGQLDPGIQFKTAA